MKQNYIQEQNFLKDEVPPQRTVKSTGFEDEEELYSL